MCACFLCKTFFRTTVGCSLQTMANNATGLKYNNTGFLYSFRPEKIVQSIVFPVVLME